MNTAEAQIGKGIYTISDMSKIFRIPKSKVRYMFNSYIRDKFEKAADYRFFFGDKYKFVDFQTLIHLYIFFELKERGISYRDIFKLYEFSVKDQGTHYPFTNHIKLYTQGKSILVEQKDGIIYTGDNKKQVYISEIIKPLSKKIEYTDNEITKFFPLGRKKSIVINPSIRHGAPTINGTRINAKSIYQLHEAGEKHTIISNMYNLSKKQIKDAVEFYSIAA